MHTRFFISNINSVSATYNILKKGKRLDGMDRCAVFFKVRELTPSLLRLFPGFLNKNFYVQSLAQPFGSIQ